jgi:hypothetical protein
MTIASVIAILVLTDWGFSAAFILQGGAMMYQPLIPNPEEVYQAIYGRIENQINTAINNKVHSNVMGQFYFL